MKTIHERKKLKQKLKKDSGEGEIKAKEWGLDDFPVRFGCFPFLFDF